MSRILAFPAFITFATTGFALLYLLAKVLVTHVAYLSPWMPSWIWIMLGGLTGLAVAVIVVGVMGGIAAMSRNQRVLDVSLFLVIAIILVEMIASVGMVSKRDVFYEDLGRSLQQTMEVSLGKYIDNSTDTQLWDEIQSEQNCCGILSYMDWAKSGYGNGSDVPDSCCLLIDDDCGRGVIGEMNPEDDIVTDGCLPSTMNGMVSDNGQLARDIWTPVVCLHGLLLLLIAVAHRLKEHQQKLLNAPISSYAGKYQVL